MPADERARARHPDIHDDVPMKAPDEPPTWLDKPGTVRLVVIVVCALSAMLLLIDPLLHRHGYVEIENVWGFYGIFGFVGCVILVLVAMVLRRIVMKPEDYYDDR